VSGRTERIPSRRESERPPARHEVPEVDEAALAVAVAADRALAAARERGNERWELHLTPLPDRLRDDPPAALGAAARRIRAAYGPKDSIRDALPPEVTEPLLDATDRLIKVLARREVHR
jgi:NifB/MoaA-like Fe-S oxidoreductase